MDHADAGLSGEIMPAGDSKKKLKKVLLSLPPDKLSSTKSSAESRLQRKTRGCQCDSTCPSAAKGGGNEPKRKGLKRVGVRGFAWQFVLSVCTCVVLCISHCFRSSLFFLLLPSCVVIYACQINSPKMNRDRGSSSSRQPPPLARSSHGQDSPAQWYQLRSLLCSLSSVALSVWLYRLSISHGSFATS